MKKVFSVVLALAMVFCMVACGEKEPETKTAEFQIGQYIGACHGTHCFTVCTAAIEGDKIVGAYIDEFQFQDSTKEGFVGVPNWDNAEGLGAYFTTTNVLGSKKLNNDLYSANMAAKGGATQTYVQSMTTLEEYCVGKTISELEAGVDAISGCTFSADIPNYVKGIVEAAKAAQKAEKVAYQYTGDAYAVKLNFTIGAAHGTKCFTIAAALTDGTTIICATVDEFQFMSASTEGLVSVPNSDDFASKVKEGQALVSKKTNNAIYSANMAAKGGATQEYAVNMAAVEAYVAGKTIAELEAGVDAVAGCTFSDASGYVGIIVTAAKQ